MKKLIDTHSHIYYDKYNHDLDEVINRSLDKGIDRIICVGVDLESSIQSLEIANKYSNVFCTVGYHPHESQKAINGYLNDLEEMCKDPKVVAIGETGLDYYYNYSYPEIQKKRFIEQIELAISLKLPVVIHNRESDNDLYEILKKYTPKGVIHCFSSDINFANKIIDLGLLLSFTGIITFKNSTLSNVIASIPISKLMVETDSPYLTPEPYRGKRNEPSYVSIVAEKIAEIKKIPIEDVIDQTTSNALKLFYKLK
jgi:TatD DNase family protein